MSLTDRLPSPNDEDFVPPRRRLSAYLREHPFPRYEQYIAATTYALSMERPERAAALTAQRNSLNLSAEEIATVNAAVDAVNIDRG